MRSKNVVGLMVKKREILGHVACDSEEVTEELVGFPSKRAKWEWMKDRGLSEVFLEIKEVFGTTEEPIITRRKT